ncbi:unnamed protein product [Tilletia controversa]|nr:unnamed protein product [Tilletia controversa]
MPALSYDAPPPAQHGAPALTDVDVITAFHSLLKDALAQARAEGLINDDLLEHAGVDIQINGPALALAFAALQAAGHPPAIRAPHGNFTLDNGNCPPSFRVFFEEWQREVIPIQRLSLEDRHSLIRLICDQPTLAESQPDIPRIAATLKSIAINLVQRRTFQLLFSDDLQHALESNVRPTHSPRSSGDFGSRGSESGRVVNQYQPPPGYEPPPQQPASNPAQQQQQQQQQHQTLNLPNISLTPPQPPPPSLTDDPNLNLIRETLLSALADVLATTPTIRHLLLRNNPEWKAHAYFACLCLAILDVALHRVTPSGGVRCVQSGKAQGKIIGMADCPLQLRRLLWALSNIGAMCQRLAEDDDLAAIKRAERGDDDDDDHHQSSSLDLTSPTMQTNRIERLRYRLENGVDRDSSSSSSSSANNRPPTREPGAGTLRLQTNVTEVSNNINQLALAFFKIPTFRERQREAFKVLAAVETL